jgi:hypothetical protein
MLAVVVTKRIQGFNPDRSQHFPRQTVRKPSHDETRELTAFELMPFDQGTVDGNGNILTHAATIDCGHAKEVLEQILIVVSGDQLTMDRARSLRVLKEGETYGNRVDWVHIAPSGSFHLSMDFPKVHAIFETTQIEGFPFFRRRLAVQGVEELEENCNL